MIAVIDTERNKPLATGHEVRLMGWTEERFWAEAPSEKVWEFVDGEVIVASPREPDIFVLSPEDAARARGSKIDACPRLIIEVTDVDSERRDLVEKPAEYAARGVPDYWSVHIRKRHIQVFRPGKAGREPLAHSTRRLESTGLPGFWIDVAWLWQEPLPRTLDCVKQILSVTSL